MSFENKPELRCESDDKAKRARRSRADPLPFVIPFSAPSVLFREAFWRRENAPFLFSLVPHKENRHRARTAVGRYDCTDVADADFALRELRVPVRPPGRQAPEAVQRNA